MKKVKILWINPKALGKSIMVGNSTILPNGLRSLGGEAGFISCGSVENKAQFQLGQEIDLPANAVVVQRPTKDGKSIPVWQF